MNESFQRERLHRLTKSLNCDGWRGPLLLSVCVILLLIQGGGAAAESALRYDRDGLHAGQWWRLLTAHVIHLGYEHAVLDIAGLVLMWALFARDYSPRQWLLIIVLAAGACAHLRRREPDGWILALFLVGKLVYEQAQGALPLTAGGAVIVDAHLYGAVSGALAVLLLRPFTKPV